MLEFKFWTWRNRIGRVYVDGKRWSLTNEPLEELFALLPEQIQRIEFIMNPGRQSGVFIYTRDYMRTLIGQGGDLPPVWDPFLNPDPWANPTREHFQFP